MNIAVIFAGGVGKRMHSRDIPKQFLELYNKPIIIHTLDVFENCDEIDAIVIACVEDFIPYLNDLIYKYRIEKVKKVVPGGVSGQMSIYNGLVAAKEVSGGDDAIVLIHDGVRPLINAKVIKDNIDFVKKYGNAITTATVKETLIIAGEDGLSVDYIPSRENSRIAKAPQSFKLSEILALHEMAQKDGKINYIDSCTMMQEYGKPLYLVDGPYDNIKITTPDDFYTMRAILEARENEQIYGGDQHE